jgi:uncharacterized linocin/CFP29 family protein
MSDYTMRQDAPLSAKEWQQLDKVVTSTARHMLVGRRFIELVGPMGAGTEIVPVGTGSGRRFLELGLIEESFALAWRDMEASRKTGVPLELGPAAVASAACARREDEMILSELLQAADKSVALSDWDEPGAALADVVAATQALVADGFYGPYVVLLSPALYAQTQRVARGMGRLVSKLIKDVAEGGLFRSPLVQAMSGLVLSVGPHNLDLVVGQDLTTAYMGNEGLDHHFRVLETLTLRIKRPGAICSLGQ